MNTYKRRLGLKQLFSNGNSDILSYLPSVRDYFFVESVRGGLEVLIDLIWAGKPGKVMLPVFIAEGVIAPFKIKKVPVVFYKLTTDLSPDIEDVETKISTNTDIKSIVVIHYFGFVQNLVKLKQLCKENQIFLFEDCVHALFSKDNKGKYVGTVGDVSFFSFPKILPVPDGGIFFINNPDLAALKRIKYRKSWAGFFMIRFHLIYLLIKSFETKLNYSIIYRILNSFTKALYFTYYSLLKQIRKPQHISKHTQKILRTIDYENLIASRKKQIKKIYEILAPVNHLLFKKEYDPNEVLIGVPIVAKNSIKLKNVLIKNNIECLSYTKSWFFMPEGKQQEYKIEFNFHKNHFLLPVNEDNEDYGIVLEYLIKEKSFN